MEFFKELKNGIIDINKHNKINKDIDEKIVLYKNEYDSLVERLNVLRLKRDTLKNTYSKHRYCKTDEIHKKRYYKRNLSIAIHNMKVCDANIDNINNALETIDTYYFNGEEKVPLKNIQPKVKKMRKIKE